jgi:cation transport ATPase
MSCAACSARVENAVQKIQGVVNAPVNLLAGTMTVEYDEKIYHTQEEIVAKVSESVSKAGYEALAKFSQSENNSHITQNPKSDIHENAEKQKVNLKLALFYQ